MKLYQRFSEYIDRNLNYISDFLNISAIRQRISTYRHITTKIKASYSYRRLLFYPATTARMLGGFASSFEAKSASTSEAPSPSHSERAASAFISPNRAAFPARICLLRLVFDHYDRRLELLLLSLLRLLLYLNLQLLRWTLIVL